MTDGFSRTPCAVNTSNERRVLQVEHDPQPGCLSRGGEERPMDETGFRQHLLARGLSEDEISGQIDAVARFAQHLYTLSPPQNPENVDAQATQGYVNLLIAEGGNSYQYLLALARYGRHVRNHTLFVAILQLLDGAEALEGMARRVGEVLGEEARDEVFPAPLPPLGLSSWEKAHVTRAVMQRLEPRLDAGTCRDVFADSFRDLPESMFLEDRQRYHDLGDFDRFLEIKRQEFIAHLQKLRDEGALFFDQEITDAVIDFVRQDPEISQGVRRGNVLYVTKIPYRTKEYLAEADPQRKRTLYCHCPWARESLRQAEGPVPATFCRCSAGFHKKPWEVIFEQPLEADVLESVLQGDQRCRFAVHLPPGALGVQSDV
jgi:hypothetical protein